MDPRLGWSVVAYHVDLRFLGSLPNEVGPQPFLALKKQIPSSWFQDGQSLQMLRDMSRHENISTLTDRGILLVSLLV